MQLTLLPTGKLKVQDQSGFAQEIGADHPDYQRYWTQYHSGVKQPASPAARWIGLAMIVAGLAAWWYNWHLAATEGHFYIKLCLLGPLGLAGGVLVMVRPEWAGPIGPDSTRAHKMALFAVIGFMAIASGIDFYFLKTNTATHIPAITKFSPSLAAFSGSAVPMIQFLGRQYHLGSFNQKHNAQWEFITGEEKVDNWKTLFTLIDRPDARTREELDRLGQGILENYRTHGGQVLAARTMVQESGAAFNYIVAAFEEPALQRYELNFVRVSLEPKNAAIAIYGVRVSDPQDYRNKAKDFLNQNSAEIGKTLGNMELPDINKLPRKTF